MNIIPPTFFDFQNAIRKYLEEPSSTRLACCGNPADLLDFVRPYVAEQIFRLHPPCPAQRRPHPLDTTTIYAIDFQITDAVLEVATTEDGEDSGFEFHCIVAERNPS